MTTTHKIKSSGTYMTAGIHAAIENSPEFGEFCTQSLNRHIQGDWGDTCEEDCKLNDQSLKDGSRIISSYETVINNDQEEPADRKIWIISDAEDPDSKDRITTILFPHEY